MKSIIFSAFSVFMLTACFGDVGLTDEEQQLNDRLNKPQPDQTDAPGNKEKIQLYLASARFAEGNTSVSGDESPQNKKENQLLFAVSLNRLAEENMTVHYQLENGLAIAGVDYRLPQNQTIVINKGQSQSWIAIDLIADNDWEISKDLSISVTRVEPDIANIITSEASGIIANDDEVIIPLADTSSLGSINTDGEYSDTCEGPYAHLLDCSFGKDLSRKNASGSENSSIDTTRFNKLDNDGSVLPGSAVNWACVRDNQTGLVWEAKQDLGRDQYHSINSKFTVLNSRYFDWDESYHPLALAGSDNILSGIPDTPVDSYSWRPAEGAEKTVVYIGSQDCANPQFVCTSEQYALEINQRGLCGFNDWHVPEIEQLSSLVSSNDKTPDDDYFPFPGNFISHTAAYDLPVPLNHINQITWISDSVLVLNVMGEAGSTKSSRVVSKPLHGGFGGDGIPVHTEKYELMLVRKDDE
ncbi:DUF1566 domain-containing protein [Bacterioplanoides sp.]|uniref:Lcl domain-containing protein n=1 Tax=Bacterioplanoides sp. TaxID=2066072 RepID=UPI003B5A401B